MHRVTLSFIMLAALFLACGAHAQDADNSATATCNFDQDKQLAVQYERLSVNLKKPLQMQVPFGKPWAPAGKPMTLFTNTPVEIGGKTLPIGAYTMFVIPTSKQWTLIVSKSTDMSGKYNEQEDLARVSMDSGELPNPESQLMAAFGHIAPDQCSFRVDLDKYGHFAVFHEAK
jgi:hypothetical protein